MDVFCREDKNPHNLQLDQQLFLIRNKEYVCTATIKKIGKKWVYCDAFPVDIVICVQTLIEMPKKSKRKMSASLGRCYLHADVAAKILSKKDNLQKEWSELKKRFDNQFLIPEHITQKDIYKINSLMDGKRVNLARE